MRDRNGLKNAFGRAGDGFRDSVYRTLAGLQTSEERIPVKKTRLKLTVAVAVAVMMITATAFALTNAWGILDFLTNRRSNVEVLPDAAGIVQKDVPQEGGQSELAAFTVREAVFDGKDVFIAVEVRPAGEQYLLLGTDSYPADPVGNMGPLFSGKTGTIADYARENNKELVHTFAGIDGLNCSIDFVLEEDGTLVYLLNSSYEAEGKAELIVSCGVAPFVSKDGKTVVDHENIQRTPLTVTLENTGTKDTVTSTAPADFSDCGVRVDRITLTGSAMGIYAKIEYTVTDAEKYAQTGDGLCFEFLDENGERLPSGAGTVGTGIVPTDDSGTRFVQELTIRAAETLPDKVTLRAYDCWEENRYEAHAFEMK